MFRLSDLYTLLLKKPLSTTCGIAIEPLNPEIAILNHHILDDRVSFFSFNLVHSGTARVLYGGKNIVLHKNHLFISAPGVRIYTIEVSDDYSGQCLIAEEEALYEIPYARNVISASYTLANPTHDNTLHLTDTMAADMTSRIEDMEHYISGDSQYKNECLTSLFSVFVLDLIDSESKLAVKPEISLSSSDLFLRFLKLIRENFIPHHDLEFYADALAVTSIYLSRIIKRISGQTVKNHIDRLLMMEARYMLMHTDLPIATVAERLNFATPASFCKFFTHHNGTSPKGYRTSEAWAQR